MANLVSSHKYSLFEGHRQKSALSSLVSFTIFRLNMIYMRGTTKVAENKDGALGCYILRQGGSDKGI